jgi:fatty-acyl-CoA synthase
MVDSRAPAWHAQRVEGPYLGGVGVGSWIERRARIAPSDVAMIFDSQRMTYGDLAGRIRRLANGLLDLGVEPSDRIAWLGPNHPAFIEAFFAAGLLGCALAPVNHRATPEAISAVLADSDPRILLHHQLAEDIEVPDSVAHRLAIRDGTDGASSYDDLVDGSSDDPIDVTVRFDDVLLLPHTSGTVGKPKGVMLTHANVTWNVVNLLSFADIRQADVTIAVAPFFRVGGTGVNVLPVLFMGGTVVVPHTTDADLLLDDIERYRVTVGFGNPDLLDALADAQRWSTADLASIRFFITGGAPVPERLIRRFLERGVTLLQGYGLSEAAPAVLLLDPASALGKVGSAGKPALLVDVRIVDGDGRDSASGQVGELWVRGPNVMIGYWRDPVATHRALTPDGWLRTGDAARMDDEGFVWIVDRIRDGFETVGGIVYPGEVERVLLDHPAVADAGVIGISRPGVEGAAVAFVVPAPGQAVSADDLIEYARQRLPDFAVPVEVEVVIRLPRNSVGKLQRDRLRAMRFG